MDHNLEITVSKAPEQLICYLSLGCWALAGSLIRSYLDNPRRLRLFNRSLAALLVLSAVYLMQGSV